MTGWMVRLRGHDFDLRELAENHQSDELCVTKERDGYYLRAVEFEALSSADEVLGRAKELVALVNGLALLRHRNFQKVEADDAVARVEADGKRHVFIHIHAAAVRVKASVVVVSTSGDESAPDPPPSTEELFLQLAAHDPKVKKALRIYGSRQHDWHNLFYLYEVIQSDVGSRIWSDGWASEPKVGLFTRTANSSQAIGDDARHGHDKFQAPKKPMPLSEAQSLIAGILHQWLRSKI